MALEVGGSRPLDHPKMTPLVGVFLFYIGKNIAAIVSTFPLSRFMMLFKSRGRPNELSAIAALNNAN